MEVNINQSRALIDIEGYVELFIDRKGLLSSQSKLDERQVFYEEFIKDIPRFLDIYRPDHQYSEHVSAFWYACEQYGLLDNGKPTWMVGHISSSQMDGADIVKKMMEFIDHYVQRNGFKLGKSHRRYGQKKKQQRLMAYVESILKKYARTLVLRIDLGYRHEAMVDINTVYGHVDQLLGRIHDRKGVFQDMMGYALCMEQGKTKGYHLHFAVFLPGHLHHRDGFLVKEIGRLWGELTEQSGSYHNCNALKDRYKFLGLCGVGMIYRRDDQGISNAIRVVGYLADPKKEDQYLRMKPLGRRTYFTGLW